MRQHMDEHSENLMGIILVAWTPAAKEGWEHLKETLSQAFQNLLPAPVDKAGPHEPFENLARGILKSAGGVKVIYCGSDLSSVEDAAARAIGENARQIVIVPLAFAFETQYPRLASATDLLSRLHAMEKSHPEVEIHFVGPPFSSRNQMDRLLSKIREGEPEASDRLQAVIRRGFKDDLTLFARFMAALQAALPEDTQVAIRGSVVTGYNFSTGRPFDAAGRGTSDLDMVLVGEAVLKRWAETGFYIPGILTMPLGRENADLAPWLDPVRERLERMVERPVHIQAMPRWFVDLRRGVLSEAYLFLDA